MADQNSITIDALLNSDGISQGITELFNKFDLSSQFDKIGQEGGVALINGLSAGMEGLAASFGNILPQTQIIQQFNQVAVELWNEHFDAMDMTIKAYDDAIGTIRKYYSEQEELARKSTRPTDKVGGSTFQSSMDSKTVEAIQELGATLEMGFAAQGTWTRRFEEIGAGLRNFFEGDVGGVMDMERRFEEGKKIAERQRQIDEHDKLQDEQAEFRRKAEEHNQLEDRKRQQREFQEAHREDERIAREEERAAKQKEREEERAFQEALKNAERFHSDRRAGKGLGESRDEFRSSVTTDALEAYRRIQTAAASPHEQKVEAFHEKALAQMEKTNEIMAVDAETNAKVLEKIDDIGGLA